MQIPYVQPVLPSPPTQPAAPLGAEPVRPQAAIQPARQVTPSRAGSESTGKDRARTGSGGSDANAGAATARSRRGQLLDLFV